MILSLNVRTARDLDIAAIACSDKQHKSIVPFEDLMSTLVLEASRNGLRTAKKKFMCLKDYVKPHQATTH